MKLIFTVLIALFICTSTPANSKGQELGAIRMSLIEGNVQIYDRDLEEWTSVSSNTPIAVGDMISVPQEGRAELHIQGGIFIRLDSSTVLELVSLSETTAHLYLDHGHIYINNKKGGREIIQIDTPAATCSAADNSISLLDVVDNSTTELSLIKGYAFLESSQGKTRVNSGNTLKISSYGAEISPISEPDEWEKWNLQRDAAIQKTGESTRYLPEELHEYSTEFDTNGKWTFVREYGYVWTPTIVSFEWAPFRLGQWIWVRNDYVWVPEERWGWAPHHYGRWSHVKGIGWSWVPPRAGTVAWGPGSVAWVQTHNSIGWVPLAPGEIYYGRRNYGHGTAQLPHRNVAHPAPVYRNIQINNAVTLVSVNSFHQRDRKKNIIKDENPFKNRNYTIPVIAPPAKNRIDVQTRPQNMHRQQETRGTTQQSYPIQIKATEPSKTPLSNTQPTRSKGVSSVNSSDKPRETKPILPETPKPASQQYKPSERTPDNHRTIQNKTAQDKENSNDVRENRGPRGFVRDSGQSAFKKDQPQQLPVKKLEEPKREVRKPVDRPKHDYNSNLNKGQDEKGGIRNTPKHKTDKP